MAGEPADAVQLWPLIDVAHCCGQSQWKWQIEADQLEITNKLFTATTSSICTQSCSYTANFAVV
jgi:hypothetical protein